MDSDLNRREALVRLGATAAGVVGGSRLTAAIQPLAPPSDLDALAKQVRSVERPQVLAFAAKQIAAGTTWQSMLGATYLAAVQDIRPRPHGILHAAMMVESVFQLADAATTAREAWQFVLFNLDDLKGSQARDIRDDGNYQMQPLPKAKAVPARVATDQFVAAMNAFDALAAERAVVQLIPHVDLDTFFELFRPFAARCYAFIGHKMIYATHTERVLRRIGWQHAEPALRSLVLTCLVDRDTKSFEQVHELAATLPKSWLEHSGGLASTYSLSRALLTAEPAHAPKLVVEHLSKERGADRAWDAIILAGATVFSRRPGRRAVDGRNSLLPVHALTVPNALRSSFLQTTNDASKRLLILQAAASLAQMRDDLIRMVDLSMKPESRIGAREEPSSMDDAFEQSSPDKVRVLLRRDSQDAADYANRLRQSLARVGREHHQHKYAAAMFEEAARVDAPLRPSILAGAVDYLAHNRDRETEFHRRATAMLTTARFRQ